MTGLLRCVSIFWLLFTGCAMQQYSKPGGTDDMMKADMNTCIKEIEKTKPPFEMSGGMISLAEMDTCLAQKGWTRER